MCIRDRDEQNGLYESHPHAGLPAEYNFDFIPVAPDTPIPNLSSANNDPRHGSIDPRFVAKCKAELRVYCPFEGTSNSQAEECMRCGEKVAACVESAGADAGATEEALMSECRIVPVTL